MDGVCQTQEKVVEFLVKTIYQFPRTFQSSRLLGDTQTEDIPNLLGAETG